MENTRKIILTLRTGYAGMTTHEGWEVPVEISDDELWDLADERAEEHAGSYGIYRPNDEEDEDETTSRYSGNNIGGSWKEYTEADAGKISFGTRGPHFNEL